METQRQGPGPQAPQERQKQVGGPDECAEPSGELVWVGRWMEGQQA